MSVQSRFTPVDRSWNSRQSLHVKPPVLSCWMLQLIYPFSNCCLISTAVMFNWHCSSVRVRLLTINTLRCCSSTALSALSTQITELMRWGRLISTLTSFQRCPLTPWLSQVLTKQINQLCFGRRTVWSDVTSIYREEAFTVLRLYYAIML